MLDMLENQNIPKKTLKKRLKGPLADDGIVTEAENSALSWRDIIAAIQGEDDDSVDCPQPEVLRSRAMRKRIYYRILSLMGRNKYDNLQRTRPFAVHYNEE
jgi:hypothetical protein